jgi:hypothetical protein
MALDLMALGLMAAGIMAIRVLGTMSRFELEKKIGAGRNRNKWILRRVGIKIARRMWTAKGTAVMRAVWRRSRAILAMFSKKGIGILKEETLTTEWENGKNKNFYKFKVR